MSEKLLEFHIAPMYDSKTRKTYGQQCVTYFNTNKAIDVIGIQTDEEAVEIIDDCVELVNFAPTEFWSTFGTFDRSVVEKTFNSCQTLLPLSQLPIHCFIFPWSTDAIQSAEFKGVNAVTRHQQVLHLYIHATQPTIERGLVETVAHEFTHLFYYQMTQRLEFTLYEHIIMEGIAEVFREAVVGGNSASWSTAVFAGEVNTWLEKLSDKLDSTDRNIHRAVLYGDETYPKWLGYSIGYHLVKKAYQKDFSGSWPVFLSKF